MALASILESDRHLSLAGVRRLLANLALGLGTTVAVLALIDGPARAYAASVAGPPWSQREPLLRRAPRYVWEKGLQSSEGGVPRGFGRRVVHVRPAFLSTLLAALPFAGLPCAHAVDGPKLKKPTLNLRATPRMAFSPVTVLAVAELAGGDDVEQYYCPEIVWEWGDGGKSLQESDCPPFEEGVSKIERRFTAEHRYRRAGYYTLSATLRRAGKSIAKTDLKLTIRPGIADPR